MDKRDVVILGAGAAGLFAGIEAARRGRSVLVIDHAAKAAGKIRISGGGRCNFTNLGIAPDRYLSDNPRFARSALSRYTQHDFIARMQGWGIAYHEKTLGQLFCDGKADQVIDALLRDLGAAGGELACGVSISDVSYNGRYIIATSRGVVSAEKLVVATGGRSIPKMGATGIGYDLARQFGLRIVATRAGLVPLTFSDALREEMASLAGLSLEAVVSSGKAAFREGLLFTHRGLSGPSILQISSYWREGEAIRVDFMPGQDVAAKIAEVKRGAGGQITGNALARLFPARLASQLASWAGTTGRIADLKAADLQRLAKTLGGFEISPMGTEGYRTAEVTLGGVDTRDLDAKTMEARDQPGLYFIGEVVDVTGWLGGYNFQWAWSSGWAAGQAV